MTDLGDLLLLLAPVTLLAAWVGYGSERISYAGLQIGLAFYLVVLQGYGPTIDMYTARDRTIGILFGNIVVFVIFTTIWPVSVANVVRTHLARALEQLAALVDLGAQTSGEISPAARSAAASSLWAGDRAGTRGPGQRSVRNEGGAARRRETADRRGCGGAGRSAVHPGLGDS